MGISLDGYGETIQSSYRDFVARRRERHLPDPAADRDPPRRLLPLPPLDRRAPVQPYATVGGDVFFYQYEEFGDFIDFFDDYLSISSDSFESDGVVFGGHAAVGLRIPVGHDFAITGEVRYQFAPTQADGRRLRPERARPQRHHAPPSGSACGSSAVVEPRPAGGCSSRSRPLAGDALPPGA